MRDKKAQTSVVVYQAKGGAIELRGDFEHENIWATQAQIAELFDIDRSVVTKHIGSVMKTGEVAEKSNVQKMHIANSDKPTLCKNRHCNSDGFFVVEMGVSKPRVIVVNK